MTNTLPVSDRAREFYARELDRDGEEIAAMLWRRSGEPHPQSASGRIIRAMIAFADSEIAQSTADRVAELEAENARLREAMGAILDAPMIDHSHPERSAYGIARAALKGSSDGKAA